MGAKNSDKIPSPKKVKTTTTVIEEGNDNPENIAPEIIEDDSGSELDALSLAISDLDGGEAAKLWVYKQPGNGTQRMEFLFTCDVGDMEIPELLQKIQTEFGGGQYRIQLRDKQVRYNRLVAIANPRKSDSVLMPVAAPDRSVEIMREMMAAQSTQMTGILAAIAGKPSQDFTPLLKIVMPGLLSLVTSMLQSKSNAADPLDQITRLLAVTGKVKEFSQGESDGGESGGLGGILKQFLPGIMEAVRQQQGQGSPQPQLPLAAPRPATIVQAIPDQPAVTEADKIMSALPPNVRMWIPVLINKASRDSDPADAAALLLDGADDDALELMHQMFGDELAFNTVVLGLPALVKYREWCIKLRAEFLKLITEGDGPENVSRTDGGSST